MSEPTPPLSDEIADKLLMLLANACTMIAVRSQPFTAEQVQAAAAKVLETREAHPPIPVGYVIHPDTFAELKLVEMHSMDVVATAMGIPVYLDSDVPKGVPYPIWSREDLKKFGNAADRLVEAWKAGNE